MPKPSLRLEKIWEDDCFFELNLSFISPHCQSSLNFYTTNEELDGLRQGLLILSDFKQNEFIWFSGEDVEKVTHYVYIRCFLNDKQGHVGFEILLDNKSFFLFDKMRSHSFVLTEINQLDDFIRQLDGLIKRERDIVEGIIPYSY